MEQRGNPQADIELFREIAEGDTRAFATFYDQYSWLLFSIAMRILNNAAEAEDVVLEASVQIWEKAGDYHPRLGKPLSWAVAITRNRAIDHLRSRNRISTLHNRAGEELPPLTEEFREQLAGTYGVHTADEIQLIRDALNQLPVEQREAIELAFFHGLTQTEIAERLEQPLGTIKARIRRGLMKLRHDLREFV